MPTKTLVRKVHPRARTRIWRAVFLKALAKAPNVTLAAKAAGVSARTAYNHRDDDPVFSEQWLDALNQSVDRVETRCFELAAEGEPRLIEFILKSFRPERYLPTSRVEVDQRLVGVLVVPEKENLPP